MKGTELVLKALKDKGVKYIFGYTGGAIMPMVPAGGGIADMIVSK